MDVNPYFKFSDFLKNTLNSQQILKSTFLVFSKGGVSLSKAVSLYSNWYAFLLSEVK